MITKFIDKLKRTYIPIFNEQPLIEIKCFSCENLIRFNYSPYQKGRCSDCQAKRDAMFSKGSKPATKDDK